MKASLMLRNDSLRYYSGDVSQAEIAAGVTIGERHFVVQAVELLGFFRLFLHLEGGRRPNLNSPGAADGGYSTST